MRAATNTLLQMLRQLATSPRSITAIVDSNYENAMRRYVAETYGLDRGLPVIDLLDLVPCLEETIYPYSFLDGQATITDIALLKGLARQRPNCRFLEIGTWRGESLANVASVAQECVSISLSRDEMEALGLPRSFVYVHGLFLAGLSNVLQIAHNSHTFDFTSLGEGFDLVFVDGDHTRNGVTVDTRNVFDVLRDEASVIVWHDVCHSPESVRWEVLAAILDGAPPAARPHIYRVSNTLCAIYTLGEFPRRYMEGFQSPDKVFRVAVGADRLAPQPATPVPPR